MKEFSLLMSLYVKENPVWFTECMNSILDSTVIPSQIVLVKDGELTTELDGIIDSYRSKFQNDLEVVELPTNQGLGAALREGLKHCKYDLVARMDADDMVDEQRFELQLKALEENESIDILGARAELIDEDSTQTGFKLVPIEHEQILKVLWSCPIIHPSVMYKKSVILNAGSYSSTLKRRQDFDLWMNCAANGAVFHNLELPLIKYRLTHDSFKRNSLSVTWDQAKIGFRCARFVKAGPFAYFATLYPLVKSLLPAPVAMMLANMLTKIDPRNRV